MSNTNSNLQDSHDAVAIMLMHSCIGIFRRAHLYICKEAPGYWQTDMERSICSGDRDAVDDETLLTASKFAKYAIAAYGQFGLDYKDETGYASQLSLQLAFA